MGCGIRDWSASAGARGVVRLVAGWGCPWVTWQRPIDVWCARLRRSEGGPDRLGGWGCGGEEVRGDVAR